METAATPNSYERNRVTPTKNRQKVEKNNKNTGKKRRYFEGKKSPHGTMKKQRIYNISENTKTLKTLKK